MCRKPQYLDLFHLLYVTQHCSCVSTTPNTCWCSPCFKSCPRNCQLWLRLYQECTSVWLQLFLSTCSLIHVSLINGYTKSVLWKPSLYNQQQINKFCALISNSSHVLNVVCFLLSNSLVPGNYPEESIQQFCVCYCFKPSMFQWAGHVHFSEYCIVHWMIHIHLLKLFSTDHHKNKSEW